MSHQNEEILSTLRQAREAAGLSQRELSARTGITQAHLSKIEKGSVDPGISTLIDVARALDLEVVLVPKKLLPAINGIIRGNRDNEDLSPEVGNIVHRELARAERVVAKQKALYGSSSDLDRLADNLKFIRSAPLKSGELAVIQRATNDLVRYQASEQSRDKVKQIGATIQALRNQLAHPNLDPPRAAYALGAEDDDA